MSRQPPADVIAAAQASAAKWRIPPSLQLAQWALESAWGAKVSGAYNYFGMKALPGQPCEVVTTHEVYKGKWVVVQAAFRKFASCADSFDAHGKLLATGSPYKPFRDVLASQGLMKAIYQLGGGTAANPRYATAPARQYGDSLAALIGPNGNNFQQYDKMKVAA